MAQPVSLYTPLAEGILDLFFIENEILMQRMYCVMQGAQINCFNDTNSLQENDGCQNKINLIDCDEPSITLFIDQASLLRIL